MNVWESNIAYKSVERICSALEKIAEQLESLNNHIEKLKTVPKTDKEVFDKETSKEGGI
jgi:GTP1/Obg family GTP-binding protein